MDINERLEKELQENYTEIGRLLGESLGEGIEAGSGPATTAIDDLGKALLESQEAYLREKERIEAETAAAQEALYRREYELRLSKAKTYQQAEIVRQREQYRLLKKANEEYLDELEENYKKVEELIKAQQAQIEAQVKAQKQAIVSSFDDIAKRATKSLDSVSKARTELEQKMESYGGLFETENVVFRNAGPKGTPIYHEKTILNLSEEKKELENYAELLDRVKSMENIPEELFSVIRSLSISDAIRYQEELLEMDSKELAAYLEDWQAIQELSHYTSNWAFAEETKRILDDIEKELADWYGTIPEGFLTEGKLSAEAFGTGFMARMLSLQSELESAVMSTILKEFVSSDTDGQDVSYSNMGNSQSITYVLNSSGETVSEQLQSARQHAELMRLRGE